MHAHAARPPRSAHASVGLPHHFALGLGLGLDDLTFRALSFILRAATPPAVPTAEAPKIFATSAPAHMGQGMSCCVGADRKSVENKDPPKNIKVPSEILETETGAGRMMRRATGLSFRCPTFDFSSDG